MKIAELSYGQWQGAANPHITTKKSCMANFALELER